MWWKLSENHNFLIGEPFTGACRSGNPIRSVRADFAHAEKLGLERRFSLEEPTRGRLHLYWISERSQNIHFEKSLRCLFHTDAQTSHARDKRWGREEKLCFHHVYLHSGYLDIPCVSASSLHTLNQAVSGPFYSRVCQQGPELPFERRYGKGSRKCTLLVGKYGQ